MWEASSHIMRRAPLREAPGPLLCGFFFCILLRLLRRLLLCALVVVLSIQEVGEEEWRLHLLLVGRRRQRRRRVGLAQLRLVRPLLGISYTLCEQICV